MSSVILLSSSPPRIFARSPTQAESPSYQDLPDGKSNLQICSRSSFKSVRTDREGFVPTFATARQVLGSKTGAENSPLGTTHRSKFRLSEHSRERVPENVLCEEQDASVFDSKNSQVFESLPVPSENIEACHEELNQNIYVQILPSDVRKKKKNNEPKRKPAVKKATPRRKDWTPPKLFSGPKNEGNSETTFPEGLLRAFECARNESTDSVTVSGKESLKRRKVEPVSLEPKPRMLQRVETARFKDATENPAKKRNKSPNKKTLTITSLATSNYPGGDENQTTPMMQYLVASQAQNLEDSLEGAVLETKVRKRNTVSSKRKSLPKSKLVSPTTAMKTFDSQDVIFASASQLVRDDSPTLLRDIVEATRLSESQLMSDPIQSQHTAPISIESDTPRLGISRFRGRRNLWGAADRDKDEALLHIDDSLDLPTLKTAFTGKDALVERGQSRSISPDKRIPNDSLHLLAGHHITTLDINDIMTPNFSCKSAQLPSVQNRMVHTNAVKEKLGRAESSPEKGVMEDPNLTEATSAQPKGATPQMPNYAGFTDEELKTQLTIYGFKRMRKRERMIDTLKKCWIDKYGPIDEEAASLRHGDFLSKIHHFSDRPKPKVKKARVRKKKDIEGSDIPKTSKNDRNDGSEVDKANSKPSIASKSKKRKSNSDTISEADVFDVSDILNTNYLDRVSNIPDISDSEPEVSSFTGVGRITRIKPTENVKLPTPPSTVSLITIPSSSPAFESPTMTPPHPAMPTPQQSSEILQDDIDSPRRIATQDIPDIKTQVCRAIKHSSIKNNKESNRRNHQTHPTFHEKILMYDPIILEDLTAWLNTEGLNAIGEDREIDIMDVRAWCEENGICCLWKGGWRGRGLKGRFDGGDGVEDGA